MLPSLFFHVECAEQLDFTHPMGEGAQPVEDSVLRYLNHRYSRPLLRLSESSGTVMAKSATVKIRLVSTADTGFFYVTKKNPRNTTEKMSFRKYDPKVRKHVEFKEAKIK